MHTALDTAGYTGGIQWISTAKWLAYSDDTAGYEGYCEIQAGYRRNTGGRSTHTRQGRALSLSCLLFFSNKTTTTAVYHRHNTVKASSVSITLLCTLTLLISYYYAICYMPYAIRRCTSGLTRNRVTATCTCIFVSYVLCALGCSPLDVVDVRLCELRSREPEKLRTFLLCT